MGTVTLLPVFPRTGGGGLAVDTATTHLVHEDGRSILDHQFRGQASERIKGGEVLPCELQDG